MRKKQLVLTLGVILSVCALFAVWYTGILSDFGFARDGKITDGDLYVYCLDVGQGDSTLLVAGDVTILIDAGTDVSERDLIARLKNLGVRKIDLAIFTHPDSDHIGGADGILGCFEVVQIFVPRGDVMLRLDEGYIGLMASAAENQVAVTSVKSGDSFSYGALTVEILSPNSVFYDEINDYSITARVMFGETSFLFPGDAGEISEAEMIDRYGEALDSSFLHVGHHGAATSTSDLFLESVSPEYAVISSGAGNTYGHPRAEILMKLEAAGITCYRTDTEGTILLISDGKQIHRGN